MATVLRPDDSHNVSYPVSADTRGTARVYHLRKPYYLGNHDSPLSYVMFGLWKHHLLHNGTPPTSSSVREQAEAVLAIASPKAKTWKKQAIMGLGLTLAALIGGLVGANFRSTPHSNDVDGIALSANETEFIRGVRKASKRQEALQKEQVADNSVEILSSITTGQVDRNEILKRIRGF